MASLRSNPPIRIMTHLPTPDGVLLLVLLSSMDNVWLPLHTIHQFDSEMLYDYAIENPAIFEYIPRKRGSSSKK
ncbi:MAG: hypothetical protein M5E90_08765 [Asgard group archaeon]|nr:hypothetical protein [Asgard group archaeon]